MIPSVVARQVRETILDYLRTTFSLADADFREALFEFLESEAGLFRGPYVDIRLPFRSAEPGERVPLDIRPTFTPWRHQLKSFRRLYSKDGHQPQHTLVTTGTGSGKTECFLFPILDHCWRNRGEGGVKAIVLYPMNALASDQARRLARTLWDDDRLKGGITAGLYVGGQGTHGAADRDHLVDKREVLRDSPPDILLTNYRMLDFLLLRPEDRKLWRDNHSETLRYLVLDELHTYDGAQGSDVACLIRRLKDRLRVAAGGLCCVGTSATVGGKEQDRSLLALTEFATKVFGEEFFDDSVIMEDRQTADEALGAGVEFEGLPPQGARGLDSAEHDEPRSWARRQVELWLGGEEGLSGVEIGVKLAKHDFLRQLLKVLGGQPRSWGEIDQGLSKRVPEWQDREPEHRSLLFESFLGLVSIARKPAPSEADPGTVEPFLVVQAQLWVRELRRLVRRVLPPEEPARFAWASDRHSRDREQNGKWLPIAYCRDCGAAGLAALQREGEATLKTDLSAIGRAWLHRSGSARYVAFGHDEQLDGLFGSYLFADDLTVSSGKERTNRHGDVEKGIPVRIGDQLSDQTPARFLAKCPDCGSDRALSMLGSRAPSLLSVSISHLFLSEYNDDKKLLAFTDSVQDASHRAGFFGARTYRFNLRTAIQGALEGTKGDVPLTEIATRMLAHWGERLDRPKLIATLMPPDLRELPAYSRFLEKGGGGPHRKLEGQLAQRLSWEATAEYGLNARVGRTLEKTLCSTSVFDEDRLQSAAQNLGWELEEEGFLDLPSGEAPQHPALAYFLRGLLSRTRARGGIDHPFLERYIEKYGAWFHLTKRRQPLISPFHRESVLPRFLMTRLPGGRRGEPVFDCVVSAASSWTWYRDWAGRLFGIGWKADGINALYKAAVRTLEGAGLLTCHELAKGSVWGIAPNALLVTRDVRRMTCPECRRELEIPARERAVWEGKLCPQYRCTGKLEESRELGDSYYADIFRSGRLERIFSHEHTGLLSRAAREKLEEGFKAGSAPDAPNLIVSTPTLEMGIDIGDLSAAMLCSVPPTVASYQQRIGRAGRKTGNAFLMVMTNHRPHDLYFHAEPKEMLAGPVLPPGCFLDAPEMLKRQLAAHAMDGWARQEAEVRAIPHATSQVLTKPGGRQFPGRFLDFYAKNEHELSASFLELFGDQLSQGNKVLLQHFGSSHEMSARVKAAFEAVRVEREDLRSLQRKSLQRIQEIEKDPESVEDPEVEKRDAEITYKLVGRLIDELVSKYPLNVLTDAGVLPNYAFPEPGVRLESTVSEEGDDGKRRYEAYEFLRPASSALRELAPFNTFYADGRKVRITEIDLGTKARPLTERWRLCRECAHMEREVAPGEPAPRCPRCDDLGWPDAGQLRTLIHFRRSRSLAARLEAATVDDKDDREDVHYATANLIDVGKANWNGARLIEELPFGYELLKNLKLRELNYGRVEGGSTDLRVAGDGVPSEGFNVCLDCGRVRDSGNDFHHAPYCRARKSGNKESLDSLFLYREVQSEAIRVLLPVSEVELERKRASFKAALELGFRRHFQGEPGHLAIRYQREPVAGGVGHRQFLVVFDAVPGGTGYLAELWREQQFMKILEQALRALETCVCQRDGRDGCYRCLYAYQVQRDLDILSSREAQAMLRAVLQRREEVKSVTTLSDVTTETLIESELERKFLQALAERAEGSTDSAWEETVESGEERWLLKVGKQEWEIRAQVTLGPAEGVIPPSRPDFVIRALHSGLDSKPVAVFCDGLAYHACPDKPVGRIADDLRKRQAIIDSGKYRVWTVTWKDVEDFENGASGPSLFEGIDQGHLGKVVSGVDLKMKRALGRSGSLEMLWAYLGQPEPEQWGRLAASHLLAWLTNGPFMPVDAADAAEHEILGSNLRFGIPLYEPVEPRGLPVLSRIGSTSWMMTLARCSQAALSAGKWQEARVLLRLFDEPDGRGDEQFEKDWRTFFQAWNLLQFHSAVRVTSSELIGEEYEPEPAAAARKVAEVRGEYQASGDDQLVELLEFATEASRPLIQAVAEAGLPLPSQDFELSAEGGEAELAWPEQKVVVLAKRQLADRSAYETAGWTVWTHPVDMNSLIAALRSAAGGRKDGEEQ